MPKDVGINIGEPAKLGSAGLRAFEMGAPFPHVCCNAEFVRCRLNRITEIRTKNLAPCIAPFKSIQGYGNRHGSIGDPLPIFAFHNNHGPISYRFRAKRGCLSNIANFPHPCIFNTPSWRGSPWNWVTMLGLKKLEWWGYIWPWKKFDDILSHFDTMQTNEHMDTGRQVPSRDKVNPATILKCHAETVISWRRPDPNATSSTDPSTQLSEGGTLLCVLQPRKATTIRCRLATTRVRHQRVTRWWSPQRQDLITAQLTVYRSSLRILVYSISCCNEKSAQRDANTARALAVRTPPARYNARPPQTGPITIHCAAKLSAQCNNDANILLHSSYRQGIFVGACLLALIRIRKKLIKKALKETQTLRAGCSKAESIKNFRPAADPLPCGAGRPKFNQLEMVTTFTYRPSLVSIVAWTQFRVIVVTDPHSHKHTHTYTTDRTDYNTLCRS